MTESDNSHHALPPGHPPPRSQDQHTAFPLSLPIAQHQLQQQDIDDLSISPTTPGDSTHLSLQKRRFSRGQQGLQVQTDIATPAAGRPALVLTPLAGALPRHDPEAAATDFNHLSPPTNDTTVHRSLSAYFADFNRGRSSPSYYDSPSGSALPSPVLSAMIDISPLPSPINTSAPRWSISSSSGPLVPRRASSVHRTLSGRSMQEEVVRKNSFSAATRPGITRDVSPRRKKAYGDLLPAALEHATTQLLSGTDEATPRSISAFVPPSLSNPKHRVVSDVPPPGMHREEYLAGKRGHEYKHLPSPPPSSSGGDDEQPAEAPSEAEGEVFRAVPLSGGPTRSWRALRTLGQGTFSKVLLATSQTPLPPSPDESSLDPAHLVAVKIALHGPAGGADEERIRHGLEREIGILKAAQHPSIVQLMAVVEAQGRTEMVMSYARGGDLFEFADRQRALLRPALVSRIYAELVAALGWLHEHGVVHRDVKLENVLVNLPASALTPSALPDPASHPHPLITLTDLGLSRRIPPPPASPLLTTRCGSEDYAAPELLLGQPYDGRLTDAWALGVLLYALMEARLPFDAPPGKPERSRNTHRIARCDWIWCRFGDEDGDWDNAAGEGWEGGRDAVDACLRKVSRGRKMVRDLKLEGWGREGCTVQLTRVEV